MAALAVASCGSQPPEDPPSAYVRVGSAAQAQGWSVLDALDAELTPASRRLVQARTLVSGASPAVAVRFTGDCAGGAVFVEEVRRAAKRGVADVVCAAALPVR